MSKYHQFMKNAGVDTDKKSQSGVRNQLIEQINKNQTVLRIKFFGGHIYGQVRYFVPDWDS